MIVPDPLPLFTRLSRLGALAAVAGVTLWWVRKRRQKGSQPERRSATASPISKGTLRRVDTKPATDTPGRSARGEKPRPAKVAVRV
jgi:hypothetical protein